MTEQSVANLLTQMRALRDAVEREAGTVVQSWQATAMDHRLMPAMANLAAYLALRRHDLSDLQPSLSRFGLSSLGRSEAHVMASLDALCTTLARLCGETDAPYPPPGRMAAGERTLRMEQHRFFGADAIGASTRIMVTLPTEAATDRALIDGLVEAGMTCARINCAHDDPATWRAMAALVRASATAAGRQCRILMDVAGPKCRIETLHTIAEKPRAFRGDRIAFVAGMAEARDGDTTIATISFPEILDHLQVGQDLWIDDGKLGTRVIAKDKGRVEVEVFSARAKGVRLRAEKGVNFPDTELHLSPLCDKDRQDLDTVAEIADSVGFSFVQRPEDIAMLHRELQRRRPGKPALPVILKIETPLAVRNLPRLIVQAAAMGPAAVMIARGDLAIELGFARMSEIQEEIMWLCEAARVPVVWATEVLSDLVAEGMPSRPEATDAAMAQRAECVMLNKGPFVVEGVRFLADVLRRMDRHQDKKTARFGALQSWPLSDLGLPRFDSAA
ncbi:MAG TPA: pyruvate kinase [Rhodopila sp.]|uniref:pyruvate kinase n=1 Tax=Rhodopila sp. TaxID=2480087 RepID=UPI002BE95963|nr:pyruvate kinase [Rhodopila sp.]HVY14892.1 pyruvate kinase [Rhodopila sp.]